MENVTDVVALADAIVAERRRSSVSDTETALLDFEDARGAVVEAIVAARVKWNPERTPSFLSFATWRGRNALSDWYRDQLGRDTPKAHAWAVSIDALAESDDGEERTVRVGAAAALAEGSIPAAILAISDPEIADTLNRIVVPLSWGFSQAEVAAIIGEPESRVSSRMRKLRSRLDLMEVA